MTNERRKVINRDNIVEDLNIEKIREKLLRACDGLEVNMVELESNIDFNLRRKYHNSKRYKPL